MLNLRSRLFECRVLHDRKSPRRHRFEYRIFMLAVDLNEIESLSHRFRFLGINGRGLFSFRERDYLQTDQSVHNPSTQARADRSDGEKSQGDLSLKERVQSYLWEQGVNGALGRVELVTMPRVAGYLFNPVSFYFCYDSADRPLASIVEVTNTFGEKKPYLLGRESWRKGEFRSRMPKYFYVSPFSDVDVAFDFQLRPVDDTLALKIDDYTGGQRTFTSVLTGTARRLSDARLMWFGLKYPLVTLKVIAAIHWEALRLYWKKVPWFEKAARPEDQRDVFQPHRSLTKANHS